MQEQKRYHQRKLAIIEMIEMCEERMKSERNFIEKFRSHSFFCDLSNSEKNMARWFTLKTYLTKRYNR